MSLKFTLLLIGAGLFVILVFCIGLLIAPTQWDKGMVGEWSNIQRPSREHIFIRIHNEKVLVRKGKDKEVIAKKDDSGHVLMIKAANGTNLYTLSMQSEGDLLGEHFLRFCGDSAVYGKEAYDCWEYKRVN